MTTPQQPAKTPARKLPREDEDELFRRAMSGARRLDDRGGRGRVPRRTSRRPAGKRADGDQEEERQFLQAMRKMGSTLRLPQTEAEPDEIARSVLLEPDEAAQTREPSG